MQRTVKGTRYTYANVTLNEDGTTTTELKVVEVPETDPKRAYKQAVKMLGKFFTPIKTETTETLWILEDEIFFKYAHKANDGE